MFPQDYDHNKKQYSKLGDLTFRTEPPTTDEKAFNAKYIVFAVNTHARLCGLLEATMRHIKLDCYCKKIMVTPTEIEPCANCKLLQEIQAELDAMAKGE